jgi:predicted MFS family arabinose efflux permease
MPAEIYDGYRYAMRHPGIGPMLVILMLFSIFGRAYIELLPGFADQVFGRGATGLAWLMSMVGLGAAVGGLWLAQRGTIVGLTSIAVLAMLVSAIALFGFSVTDNFWLALPCVAIAGFGMIVLGVGEQTLIQNAVDPAKSGRVLGLYGMIGRGAPAVGALAMGGLSSLVGLQWPVAGGAVLCMLLWLWARGRRRAMAQAMEIER